MIQIRKNVFETNSSSTHCLVLSKEENLEVHEELFQKEYVIKPWVENYNWETPLASPYSPPWAEANKENYELKLESIEDKLTYFLTMYYQSNYDCYMDRDNSDTKFMKRLQKLFPNTVFALRCDDNSRYILEDGEYFLDNGCDGTSECDKLMALDDHDFKLFMEYGVIYFGNRDNINYEDFIYYGLPKQLIVCRWSG